MSAKTALLVIDVQTGMFEEDPPIYQGEKLLARVRELVGKAREAGTPVVFVRHNEKPGGSLATGTPGWEIHPGLAPQPGEPVVDKRFPDSFQETNLQQELEALDVKRLVICGIQTEYCVDTTTRRAFSLGYEAVLVTDAHGTWDSQQLKAPQIIAHHNRVLSDWYAEGKETAAVEFDSAG